MYGSNFWSWTLSPRATSSRPIEAAAIPLPSDDTTPPVMKMKRVSPAEMVAARRRSLAIDRTSSVVDLATVAPQADRTHGGSRRLEQLPRVLAGRPVSIAGAEHPDQLADHSITAEQLDARAGGRCRAVFHDREVALGQRRDLGQVGDAENLPVAGKLAQVRTDGASGVAAHAGIDLVEHEQRLAILKLLSGRRGSALGRAQQGQHHARELAARGDLLERTGRQSRVGCDH